jgi:hypothetical protein
MKQGQLTRSPSTLRLWLGRTFAVLLGLIFALLLLEVFLRVATPLLPLPLQLRLRQVKVTPFSEPPLDVNEKWWVDPYFGVVAGVNTSNRYQQVGPTIVHLIAINWLDPNSNIGFRVPSANWQPRWPVDAVVVGDSFTFCVTEYADCWVQRLDTDHGLSVVNLGQYTTGSLSHQRLLETFGLPYEPRLVIWQWYGNDFNDDYGLARLGQAAGATKPKPAYVEPDTKPQSVTLDNPLSPVMRWLRVNSATWHVLSPALTSVQRTAAGQDLSLFPYQIHDGNIDFAYGNQYTRLSWDLSNPNNRQGFAITRQAILETRDKLALTHTPLIIVLIPTKEEVYRPWVEKQLGSAWLDTLTEGRFKMLDFCREENLLCLDATPNLIAHANQRELVYWPNDAHLNPLGNHILSDAVWDFLTRQGLAH